ncbi:MAG: acetyl/propionyl/methylcrotonyl-CoA carboxylase subunit alpha, partial [Hyphococcus sp.]
AADSYLNIAHIIDAAKTAGADAVHPGYGFLSENAAFARACAEAGVIFIGPPADAIEIMGDKAKAKRRMIEAGVPCVPGYQGEDQSDTTLIAAAKEIGFPIMVKAAAGGGGRGMRLVEKDSDLPAALATARSEAENAFGAGALILEKAILKPRHVEIQVFADAHGHVIHLGERDCSVQRRHQKVLEEAPSPAVTPAIREAMGAAAVKAARDIGYVGAGTVEFLLDANGDFYFLEMNTRLQVEHPVTEMVTGLDLVALQLRVAEGGALDLAQEDIRLDGWAIEARLYAEDPSQDFLPMAGMIDFWRPARRARTDAGVATGVEVSAFYDPMIAKVIAHGATRDDARRALVDALKTTAVFGPATNKGFLIDALEKPDFASGGATTAFIAENFTEADLVPPALTEEIAAAAAVLLFVHAREAALAQSLGVPAALMNWRSASPVTTPYRLEARDVALNAAVTPAARDVYAVATGERAIDVRVIQLDAHDATLTIDGRRLAFMYNVDAKRSGRIQLSVDGADFDIQNLNAVAASAEAGANAGTVIAPMHGLLVDVFVEPGQAVEKGARLGVLEAMKMQHELTAPLAGKVAALGAAPGAQVAANSVLFEIEPDA